MGCGCGKGKAVQAPGATGAARRVTVYEVIQNGAAIGDFSTLPEARAKATEVSGGARVRVTSKMVSS